MDLEDLQHNPVFDMETEQFLGYVIGTVVDADRTRLLGIVTRTRFARPKMVAPAESVHLMHHDGVIIARSGFRWLPLQKAIWRASRRQRKAGQLTATCNGETVGAVFDCAVRDDGRVTHLLVQRSIMGKSVRVKRDKILKIEDGVVFLADDALEPPRTKKPKEETLSRESFIEGAAAMFGKTLAKASHRVKTGANIGLTGKPAPWTVTDDDGNVLVKEGKPLTREALAVEAARGRTSEVTGAVAGGALARSLAKRRKKKS